MDRMSRESETRRQVDKQLSFALYGAANRIMRMHRPFLEPLGLTFPQYLVVLELLDTSPQLVGKIGIQTWLGYQHHYANPQAHGAIRADRQEARHAG